MFLSSFSFLSDLTADYLHLFLLSLKLVVANHMDRKQVEVPRHVEENFPDNLKLSQIIEMWKYAVTAKQEWLMEG